MNLKITGGVPESLLYIKIDALKVGRTVSNPAKPQKSKKRKK